MCMWATKERFRNQQSTEQAPGEIPLPITQSQRKTNTSTCDFQGKPKKKKREEEKRSTLISCDQSQLVLERKRFNYQKRLSINLLGNQASLVKFQAHSPKPSITSENLALYSVQVFCYLQQQNSKAHQFSTWPKKTGSLFTFPITNLKSFLPLDYMPASYHCYLL